MGKKTAAEKPATAGELLARKKPRRAVVEFPSVDGQPLRIQVQAIGRAEYAALAAAPEHRPTSEQRREFKDGLRGLGITGGAGPSLTYNPDTYPPALIAACAVDPPLTVDEATDLWTSPVFSTAELAELFTTCISVNTDPTTAKGDG